MSVEGRERPAKVGAPGEHAPSTLGKAKLADAKRDIALHALVAARRTGLASEHVVAQIAVQQWVTAELLAGRVTA